MASAREHPSAPRALPSPSRTRGAPTITETVATCLEITMALAKAGYDVHGRDFTMALLGVIAGKTQGDRADALLALLERLEITKAE